MQILKILLIIISIVIIGVLGIWGYLRYKTNHVIDSKNLAERIDKNVEKYMKEAHIKGLVVGIVKNNQTYYKGYGRINDLSDEKPDSNTIFELASIGKVFTAAAVNIGIFRKEMDWNQTLANCLKNQVKIPQNYKGTLLHLATHTSGLPSLPQNMIDKMIDEKNPYKAIKKQDIYDYLKECNENTTIGTYEYSNFGMGVLGHILELENHEIYENIVKKEICNVLGMKNTTITLSDEQKKLVAQGYDEDGNPNPIWQDSVLTGAGSFLSNTADMCLFIKANLNKNYASISPQLIACHEPQLDGITGLGWHLSNTWMDDLLGLKGVIWHNGGAGGYSSYIALDPKTKSGIIVLCNSAKDVTSLGTKLIHNVKNISFSK